MRGDTLPYSSSALAKTPEKTRNINLFSVVTKTSFANFHISQGRLIKLQNIFSHFEMDCGCL